MRMYLASIGWIEDIPNGNRLRWTYPVEDRKSDDNFLSFPETIVVERARLDEDIPSVGPVSTSSGIIDVSSIATVPFSWWDDFGTVSLSGMFPVTYTLSSPIQAVSFTYHGLTTRMLVRDTEHDQLITERILSDGDLFFFETSSMNEFIFLALSVDLHNFRSLDLFRDRPLEWEDIAEIHVGETLNLTYEEVQKRYDHPLTLSGDEWAELKDLAYRSIGSTPATINPDRPSPWQIFNTVLGLRWEFAILFGYGFFDGPHSSVSPIDEVRNLLELKPTYPVAYRVREKTSRVEKSNIVVCPPVIAKPLSIPSIPQYIDPTVRLADKDIFDATLILRWQQFDARAIGVEVEEEIGGSPSIDSIAFVQRFHNRSHISEDPPFQVNLTRSFDVPFYDVKLRSRIRAQDGWDRVSPFSAWSTPTLLSLIHSPYPPLLASAEYDDSGQVHLIRQMNTSLPDWRPDAVVKHADGNVNLYRSLPDKKVRIEKINFSMPINVKDRLYKTKVTPVLVNFADFENGYIIVGRLKTRITKISTSDLFFEVPDEGDSISLFKMGQGTVQQDEKHESLWVKVKEFPVSDLPIELIFNDPIKKPSDKADVISCYARLSYLGRLGPASNIVHAIRMPPSPDIPPPFSVQLLGIDFYNRTMIKIRFTEPVIDGVYSVWWAEGSLNTKEFPLVGVLGEYGVQSAYQGRDLYDVLSLPLPLSRSHTITIGVQKVNKGNGQSNFQTLTINLKTTM